MYLEKLRPQLSQGDIFFDLDIIDSAQPNSPPKKQNVILLNHTCDIIKPDNLIVLVCALFPLANVDAGQHGNFIANKVIKSMYLEENNEMNKSYIDFRYTFRLHKLYLEEAIKDNLKKTSLTDKAQKALAFFYYRYLIRKIPEGDN